MLLDVLKVGGALTSLSSCLIYIHLPFLKTHDRIEDCNTHLETKTCISKSFKKAIAIGHYYNELYIDDKKGFSRKRLIFSPSNSMPILP